MPYRYSIIRIRWDRRNKKLVADAIRQKITNFLMKIGWIPLKSGGGGSYYQFYSTNSSCRFTLTKAQVCTSVHPCRRFRYTVYDQFGNRHEILDKYVVYQYQAELFIRRNEYLPWMSQAFTPGNLISMYGTHENRDFLPWKVLYFDSYANYYYIVLESFPIKRYTSPFDLPSVPYTYPLISLTNFGFSPFTQTFVSKGENDDRFPVYITFDIASFRTVYYYDYEYLSNFFYVSDAYPHGSMCSDFNHNVSRGITNEADNINTDLHLLLYGDKNLVLFAYTLTTIFFYSRSTHFLFLGGHIPVFAPIGKMRGSMTNVATDIHTKLSTLVDMEHLTRNFLYRYVDIQLPNPTILYGMDADYFMPVCFFGVDEPLSDDVPLFHSLFLGFSLPWMLVRVAGSHPHPHFCVFGKVYSGVSTGNNTAEILNDTNANWDTDVFKGKTLALVGGTGGFGQVRKIISNSRTRLIVDRPFDVIPDNTTKYVICNFFYRRVQNSLSLYDEVTIRGPRFYLLEHPDYYVEV